MKILILIEALNFQQFTRRTTTEAIGKLSSNSTALCQTHIRNLFKVNKKSFFIKVRCLYYFIPKSKEKNILSIIEKYLLKLFWGNFFNNFEYVMFTSPNQVYLIDYFKAQKKIFLISDPYHLMGTKKEHVAKLLNISDIILVTALELKYTYLPKYFNFNKNNVYYWPNTVDLEIWNYSKLKQFYSNNSKIVCGFSGNFMEVLDLDLLDYITSELPYMNFELAGKINYSSPPLHKLNKIFSKENVNYLGYVNYNELPKKVVTWDICLMLDAKTEFASYHHHNKLYQYLALGKPVVVHKNLNDYDKFSEHIFISNNYNEYLCNIKKAALLIKSENFISECLKIAKENSSEVRAKQFFDIIQNK
jgi:glycosyltransferase involved in cell wall biosynthesis